MTTLTAFLWIIGLTAIAYVLAESTLAIWRGRGSVTHNNNREV